MSATFELDGQRFMALNGGPSFTFAQGISLFVSCETQAEIDDYSAKLTAGSGEQGPCGWLTDRFGVSWQIIPAQLGKWLGDKDPVKARRALHAMLQMKKLDIAQLQQAHDG
jgi:predicted 3-demethylubiquinone-9 3-methyltransferase (glyoxalase superfamily)